MPFARETGSRKGFYLVSPMLGFFFFLITVSIAALYITENEQQIRAARAGEEHELAFISGSIEADVFDVFFQNYLQHVLDTHAVGGNLPIKTQLIQEMRGALSRELELTYGELYRKAFGINCDTSETAYSLVALRFNGEGGTQILETMDPFSPQLKTAIWPYVSHYGLRCVMDEPPIESGVKFVSRWYYLDADCICCQAPQACDWSEPPPTTRNCSFC